MIHQGISIAGLGFTPYLDGVGLVTDGLIVQTTGIVLDPVTATVSEMYRPSLSVSYRSAGVSISHRGASVGVTE